MILVVVVPKISSVFSKLKIELPLPTRIMILVSNLILNHTVPLAIGLVVFLVVSIVIYRRFRRRILSVIFSLPIISTLIKSIDLTRFARTMHLLLSSGIPIDNALLLSQNVVIKTSTAKVISASRDMIMAGKKLTDGLKTAKGIVPTIVIKLVEAGEKSGSLEKSMQEIAKHLDYQVSNNLKTFTAVLEPVMLLAVGVGVGGMMLAIIAPIYGLIGQVGAR